MLNRVLSILNFLFLAFILWWNYYSNTGNINGSSIGGISAKVTNLFTPASYAFSIWGIIYLLLIANSIFLISRAFNSKKTSHFVLGASAYLIIANMCNAIWIWFWLHEQFFASVICMLGILSSLTLCSIKLNLEKYDAPLYELIFLFWPISIYLGWISVATIANIASWFTFINWDAPFGEIFWGITLLIVATILGLFMLYTRNMREFVAVIIWALIAIAVRNWETHLYLSYTAILLSGLLAIENTRHAFKNSYTLPHNKIRRGEW